MVGCQGDLACILLFYTWTVIFIISYARYDELLKIFCGSPNVWIVYIITKKLFSGLPRENCNIWEANNMARRGGYYREVREVREVRVQKDYVENIKCPHCGCICKNQQGLAIHIGKMHKARPEPPKQDVNVNVIQIVNIFERCNLNNWSLPLALLHTSLLDQSYDTRSKWLELRVD